MRLARSVEVEDDEDDEDDTNTGDVSGVPAWYLRIYCRNSSWIDNYGIQDVKRPRHFEVAERFKARPNPAESYKLYQNLLQEQDQGIGLAACEPVDQPRGSRYASRFSDFQW